MARILFLTDFSGSLRPQPAARHRPLCPRRRAGLEPLPAAAVDPRQVRHRGGHRPGQKDACRRRHRAVLQHGQRRAVRPQRHHHHRPGLQGALHDHSQHHRAPLPGRENGGRVLRQERIPPLRLLRHARRRLVRRAHAGIPRNGPCREPVVHLLGVVQEHAERPVGLRHEPAGDLAAVAAQTSGDHGLRRQPRLPHHRSLPAGRGGGVGCASPTTSRCWA